MLFIRRLDVDIFNMADLNYFFLSSTLKNQFPIAKYVTFYIYTPIHSWRGSCSFVKPNLFLAILDNPGSKKLIIDVIHEISVVKPLTFLSGEVVFSIWNNIHFVQHDLMKFGWCIYLIYLSLIKFSLSNVSFWWKHPNIQFEIIPY